MRLFIFISLAGIVIGSALMAYAFSLPVYTDREAPFKLSRELQFLPREERFKKWRQQLSTYETPHKALYDWGQSILGLGTGIGATLLILNGCKKHSQVRNKITLTGIWIFAWLLQALGMAWHYIYRFMRFDYPTWGDSIIIALYGHVIFIPFACGVSTLLLLILFWRAQLPKTFMMRKPRSWIQWVRSIFIAAWLLFLVFAIVMSMPLGDIGIIVACFMAGTILYLLLCAEIKPRNVPREKFGI